MRILIFREDGLNILITGANGQLAKAFIKYFEDKTGFNVTALTKEQLDVSVFDAVYDAVRRCKPHIVLNCSAYNLVDKAEEDVENAFRVNAKAVKNLASVCKRNKSLLVHYSTDYVFDGTKEDIYTENDSPNPINNYGLSKLQGEKFLFEGSDNFLLFRVSWVMGDGKQNFLYKLSEWAKKNKVLKIVCDQVSVPTYTDDAVNATMLAIDRGLRGLYHLTNSGYASRYEVARYFIEKTGSKALILPVKSDYFPLPAKRPFFSVMSNDKLSQALGYNIPHWKDGIDRFISVMRNE